MLNIAFTQLSESLVVRLHARPACQHSSAPAMFCVCGNQCWGKLLLKVMHYNIVLLPKKVTNYVTTFYGK